MHFLNYLLIFSTSIWGYLDTAATPPNKTNTGGWENAFSNESTLIPLVHLGEKSYYFGIYFKATFLEADQFCRDIHMELVRVQTADENDKLFKYTQESTKEDHFWTAGSKLVDKRNWIWMTTGEVVGYTNWGSGQPDNPNTELCLELWLFRNKGLVYNDRPCDVKFPFICEKDKRKPQVPRDQNDPTWSALFQNPSVSPNVNLLNFQGKSYYFGTYFKATQLQAIQFCELLHMQLVSITSDEENSRLHKYIRDTSAGDNFWTSGSKAVDGKTWIWLSTGETVDYTHWLAGQPDSGNEFCIELVQQKDTGLFWNNLGCDSQLYFICDKKQGYTPPSGPGPVVNTTPRPEPVTQTYPDDPSLPETTVGNRKYRVSKVKATQEKASQKCKQFGMELVTIQDKAENDIVTDLIRQSGQNGSSDYHWTSAKRNADNTWIWGDQQPLTYTNWASGEPNNAGNNESCLLVYTTGHWNDYNCNNEIYFICEGPNAESPSSCGSQPVINVYVSNYCSSSKNETVTETKKVASSRDGEGYNVEINNNIGTCSSTKPLPQKQVEGKKTPYILQDSKKQPHTLSETKTKESNHKQVESKKHHKYTDA